MADTDPLDLDAIKARSEAAMPAPWHLVEVENKNWTVVSANHEVPIALGFGEQAQADAAFVAAARSDIPALLDLVSRLKAQVRQLEDALEDGQRLRDQLAAVQEDKRVLADGYDKAVQRGGDAEIQAAQLSEQLAYCMSDAAAAKQQASDMAAELGRLRDQLAAEQAANKRIYASWMASFDAARAAEGVVARITADIKKLHAPYPMYAECEHDDCPDAWEADNAVFVCGPVTSHVCDMCRDEDGEPSEYPCPTARAVLAVPTNTPAPDAAEQR